MVTEPTKKKTLRSQAFTELGLALLLILSLNFMANRYFVRFDLTEEKRYSLSEASKQLATQLDEDMYVQILLDGDFKADFKQLRNAAREMFDEFNNYSGGRIEVSLVDPFDGANSKQVTEIVNQLAEKGLQPLDLKVRRDDGTSSQIIIPGAIINYKGKEYVLNLMQQQLGRNPEDVINESIESLEYEIANVIRKVTASRKKKVAFTMGHGELNKFEVGDLGQKLSDFYEVARLDLTISAPERLREFDALIIAKPDTAFSDYEQFKLDQFIMHGGKVIWMVEHLLTSMDSINKYKEVLVPTTELNLNGLLFKYGCRVNYDLIQDKQCTPLKLAAQLPNGMPQWRMEPWVFYPLLTPDIKHPIVNNLEPVMAQFAASIDTVGPKDIKKTVLLHSSGVSRLVQSPAIINLSMVSITPDPILFRKSNLITALLLEGEFNSFFTNHRRGSYTDSALAFKQKSPPNKMIVISDGDIARNLVMKNTGEIFPLGYDRNTNQTFGNGRFMINCVDYLCDESGILDVRGKEFKIRLLEKAKVETERERLVLINMIVPVLLIIVFGVINYFWRRYKYAK